MPRTDPSAPRPEAGPGRPRHNDAEIFGESMNTDKPESGAERLVHTLIEGGVDVCFANPGTSEMHFVGALDRISGMRCVLGLFEGIVTGAADGYYRVSGKPAATLLHLAPGLANGLANLHNAKKARSGIVNIVGDHATYHAPLASPLAGDVEAVARPMSNWVRTTCSADSLAGDAAEAVALARQSPGKIATLILPADISWCAAGEAAPVRSVAPRRAVRAEFVDAAAEALRRGGSNAILLLGDGAVRGKALSWAGAIAAATGCRLMAETHNACMERGAGRAPFSLVPYTQPVEAALKALAGTRDVVLAGARDPIAFFAYPGKPVKLLPADCNVCELASPEEDIEAALEAVARALGVRSAAGEGVAPLARPAVPTGPISHDGLGEVIAALLPEQCIVIDEAVTAGRSFYAKTRTTAPHDWISSMGAAIGFALPAAVGAAIAAPGRKVLALSGDGSAMYTPQALWSMAREGLDVTIVIFANRAYQILRGEFFNMGSGVPGARAEAMLTIGDPALDWQSLAKGCGVECGIARDLEEFARELRRGFASQGPYLVEVRM
ncbi:hypothetical protein HHI_16996 [Hyphomonas hirschiana VP5]|nr:hypothetical protein HHI_16996 [Hyphomonas hirschiana VP5]